MSRHESDHEPTPEPRSASPRVSGVGELLPGTRPSEIDDEQLRRIVAALGEPSQVDLARYRDTTVRRQVMRRMMAVGDATVDEYLSRLGSSPDEARRLEESVLVAVTSFFRDPPVFEALRTWVAERAQNLTKGSALRVWVPGCASGEEAYSIAMVLYDVLGPRLAELDVHVFATDADERATRFARAGVYGREAGRNLGEQELTRYFSVERDQLRVAKHVRDLCVFATHDLLRQPPFRNMDLVSCRNVLIYFQRDHRQEVLHKLHYALNPGGCLLLGQAESVAVQGGLFDTLDAQNKLYVRRPGPSPRLSSSLTGPLPIEAVAPEGRASDDERPSLESVVGRALEAAYIPPSVLVDDRGAVLHLAGGAQRFLTLPQGRGDFSVGALCIPALRGELKTLLHLLSTQEASSIASQPVEVSRAGGGAASVRVVGRKLPLAHGGRAFLLSFEEREVAGSRGGDGPPVPDDELASQVVELRQELSATREHLHSLVEQLETANDRMLSANQELQASSEEVQSANEELQASNEELLSLNEELQLKSQDLLRANDTLSSIQNSIQVALVVVDAGCHVVSFNALAVRIFGLMPRDHGRSLTSVPCSLRMPDVTALVDHVVRSGEPSVHRIDDDGRHYLLQVSPHESSQRVRTGAVLAFTDVGELRRVEQESQRLFEHFRATFEQATTGIAHVSLDGRWLRANRHWCEVLGYTEDELCRKTVVDVTHPDDLPDAYEQFASPPAQHREWEKRYLHKDGRTVWAKVAYTTVNGGGSLPAYRVVVLQDITAERAAEERLRSSERELRQVVASLPLLPLSARADGTLEFVGEQWSDYLGVPTAEVSARGIAAFVHPSEQTYVAERIARAVSEQSGFELSLRLRQHDGIYRWFSLRMRPLVDERGKVVRWFAAASDLHESIALRERLEATIEALNVTLTGASVASFNVGRRADGEPAHDDDETGNPELWRLLRLPSEVPAGTDRATLVVHPEDLERSREVALSAMARCEPYEASFRTAPELGMQRWMLVRATPIFDADGACRRYRGVLVDITAQKLVEQQHRETLARLTRANTLAGVGHFTYDLVTRTVELDAVSRTIFDLAPGEPFRTGEILEKLEQSSREQNRARILEMFAQRVSAFDVTYCLFVRGERRYVHMQNGVEYDALGRPLRLVSACRDVTAEHEARVSAQLQQEALERLVETRTEALRAKERQLEAVLNGVPCAIGYWDYTQRSRFANDAHRDWFGTSPEAMHGHTIGELWRGGFARDLADHVSQVLAGERISYELAVEASVAQATEPRFAHVYFVPDGEPGQVAGFFSLVFDITSLKRAQRAADAARMAKGQFLANMSHEIRTPLTAVLGLAELGRRSAPTRDTQECFGNIQRAGRHLLAVISDILDFSRIEAGKLELSPAPVDLGELLAQVVTTVAGAAHEKGLRLRVQETASLPSSVHTDPARVAQVMINLLSNAVKFTERGHVELTLGYEAKQLTITIDDTGVGIPAEIQRRLFEPFEQGVPRGGNRVGGTGLGLAICKRIVALLEGRLEITSEPGRGTTVRVSLPCEALSGPELASFDGTLFVGHSPELAQLANDFAARGCSVRTAAGPDELGPQVRAIITDHASVGSLATQAVRTWHEQSDPPAPVFLLSRDGDPAPLRALPPWLGAALVAQQLPATPLMLRVAACHAAPPSDELGDEPLARVRVLAAEDQEINRVLLREMLATTGASLVCVDNGRKVVDQLEADGPDAYDVVLCDIEMPELDGYEATLAMRTLSPQLPIVGLTAHAFELARERGRAVGMTDYLTKPYTLKNLVEVIARAIGRR